MIGEVLVLRFKCLVSNNKHYPAPRGTLHPLGLLKPEVRKRLWLWCLHYSRIRGDRYDLKALKRLAFARSLRGDKTALIGLHPIDMHEGSAL